jgi:pseudouridine kinase
MMEERFTFSAEKPVLVIGSAGVDIVGRLRSELHTDSSNPAQIRFSFGGVARNVAENLARLGQPVRLITAIGEDDAAGRLLDGLVEAGVDVGAVLRTADGNTGTYLAVFDQAGNRQFALDDMRIVSGLTSQYMRQYAHLFEDASMLFIDANLPKDTLRTVMSLARRAHLPVCADPTTASLAHRLRPYIPRFFMITPNSSEASILCDPTQEVSNRKQALTAVKCLVSQGVDLAIITLAEQGLCYATSEVSGYIPALRTGVLDPTGAGDALSATVIFAILNGIQIDEAMRLGVSAASLTLRYRGAVVPDLSLEKLYDRLVV